MKHYLHKIIIGQLLADAHIERISNNCRISFSFGTSYKEYADWIHSLFQEYCSNPVYSVLAKAASKTYLNYRLKTKTISCFNSYREMFYKEINGKFVKIVPINIAELMCPIVLAHLIIGDGSYSPKDKRIRIFTNSFTFVECEMLANSITNNLGITCKVMFDRKGKNGENQYILTIGSTQLSKVQAIVGPHMHSSMLYKLGL